MNRAAVADVLRVPVAAYPTFTASEDVVDLWNAALDPFDASIVRAVMGAYVVANDDPPTVHQIVSACKAEVRARAIERERRTLPRPGSRDAERAKGTIAYMREIVAAATSGMALDPAEVVAEARRRGLVAEPVPRRCVCDSGLVEVDGGVIPCERCSGDAHIRWAQGAFDPIMGMFR